MNNNLFEKLSTSPETKDVNYMHLFAPTEIEKDLMIEFRKKIRDLSLPQVELEDKVLVRWLRARNNNLKDAEQMLRKHDEWKIEMDIENIFENGVPSPEWDDDLPWILSGFTKLGSPVCISDSTNWDFAKFVSAGKKTEFIRYAVLTLEEKWGVMILQGENRPYIPQLISIYDLKGLSWRQLSCAQAIETALTLTRMAESNYPEIVQTLILVNVPKIFTILWKLLTPFVSERTKSKILFLGWDKSEWTRERTHNGYSFKLAKKGQISRFFSRQRVAC